MKKYKADQELEKILIALGFVETTSERNKKKGKKSFKLSQNAKKEIHFDYINIQVFNSFHEEDSRIEMTELELKSLLLYFKLKSTDFKEIDRNGCFDFNKTEQGINSIKTELKNLIEFDVHKARQNKLNRIIETYTEIRLN